MIHFAQLRTCEHACELAEELGDPAIARLLESIRVEDRAETILESYILQLPLFKITEITDTAYFEKMVSTTKNTLMRFITVGLAATRDAVVEKNGANTGSEILDLLVLRAQATFAKRIFENLPTFTDKISGLYFRNLAGLTELQNRYRDILLDARLFLLEIIAWHWVAENDPAYVRRVIKFFDTCLHDRKRSEYARDVGSVIRAIDEHASMMRKAETILVFAQSHTSMHRDVVKSLFAGIMRTASVEDIQAMCQALVKKK